MKKIHENLEGFFRIFLVIAPIILKLEKLLNLDGCLQVLLFLKITPKVTKELSHETIKTSGYIVF